MVQMEFRVSQASLSEDKQSDPASREAGVLQETYFVMPVRLRVTDVDLLETHATDNTVFSGNPGDASLEISSASFDIPWMELPLLGVASLLPVCLEQAQREGVSQFNLPGSGFRLLFRVSGEEICVESEVNGRQACASYDELSDGFRRFASSVRRFLLSEFPDLAQHKYWGSWLVGSDAPAAG